MREAELLDELANLQQLQNPNWDLNTRIQMCAEAVAYGKLRPKVAERAFGAQVFAEAMPLVTDLVKKEIDTGDAQVQPASPRSTAYGLAARIRSIRLRLHDAVPTVGLILKGGVGAVAIVLCVMVIRTTDNFFHGRGLYSGTMTIIEPTKDSLSYPAPDNDSALRARISEQINDMVRKLASARTGAPSADEERRAVQEIVESSEQVNESLQKLERKIRDLSQTLKVDAGLKISHDGFNLKLAAARPGPNGL